MCYEANYYDVKSKTQELKRASHHVELEQKAKKQYTPQKN